MRIEGGERGVKSCAKLLPALVVFLIPVFLTGVFMRLLVMTGVPVWYLVLHALLIACSLVQVVFFLSQGVLRAFRGQTPEKKG